MRNRHWRDGWLTAEWTKKEQDITYSFPDRPDGHLLHFAFDGMLPETGKTLLMELEARGYDLETLQFSIRKKTGERP